MAVRPLLRLARLSGGPCCQPGAAAAVSPRHVVLRSRSAWGSGRRRSSSAWGSGRRAFSTDDDGGDGAAAAAAAAAAEEEEETVKKSNRELDREGTHMPPPCEAWNLNCPTWQSIDRDNTLITPSDPDDPDDYSRIVILEDYETDHKSLHLGRMDDAAKYEMFRRHREDPEGKWTVERLAATYGISQPRTQAILLLKTWEEAERAEGRVTEEDDAREAAVHEAHVAAVAKLLDQQQGGASSSSYSSSYSSGGRRGGRGADADADLNAAASASAVGRAGAYREDGAAAARGGPLGKFRPLRDDDALPAKPDPDAPAARTERLFTERKKLEAEQDAAHLRVPSRRWTFVVKDTTQRAVK